MNRFFLSLIILLCAGSNMLAQSRSRISQDALLTQYKQQDIKNRQEIIRKFFPAPKEEPKTEQPATAPRRRSNYSYYDSFQNPVYSRRTSTSIQIYSIIRTSDETIVSGRYTNFNGANGWCNINRNTIIYDNNTGQSHRIIRSEGIPMSPNKVTFSRTYETIDFKFYFGPLPPTTTLIDFLEFDKADEGFNFYQIQLNGNQRPTNYIDFQQEAEITYTVVEEEPEFPGGTKALMDYISQNLRYPANAAENGIQGRVSLTFVVDKDGAICDIQPLKSPSQDLTQEAIRVVRSMPRWKPGRNKGQYVRVKYVLPITFRLT